MSPKSTKTFNYGDTMKSLEELLDSIDSEDLDVDAAISKFEAGMKMVKELEDYLSKAENRIEKIKKQFSSE